jgi:hypothetical protein
LLAVCAVLGGVVLLSSARADAAPLADCTSHRGTIVAVDFAHWGGPIVRGCGIEQPTGYDLMHAAGFSTAGDAQDGSSFVCRIGDAAFHHGTQYPTPSEDPCIETPPGSAYWSFWLAPAGQNTWSYSSLGPLGDVPKPGEVELWMFGGTTISDTGGSGVPHFSPSTLRATTATGTTTTPGATTTGTATTTTARATTTTPRATTTRTATTTTPAATSTTTATTTHAATSPASTAPRTTPAAHAGAAVHAPGHPPGSARRPGHRSAAAGRQTVTALTPAAGTPVAADAKTTAPVVVASLPTRPRGSSGSAVPLVVGICLALALATGAAWTARRRRRYE